MTTHFAVAGDGVRLAYEEHGRGEPVLLHSGGNYDRRTWLSMRDEFVTHRLIVFDQRGNGESDRDPDLAYDPRTVANDVIAVLDACGVERTHLGGLSRGGQIALQVVADHPERVATLILVSTSPGGPHQVPVDPKAAAKPLPSRMYSEGWLAAHPEQLEERRSVLEGSTPEVRAKRSAAQQFDLWESLPSVRVPTLILHGTADEVLHPDNARLMAERMPDARLVLIPGGRHGMHREFRAEVFGAMIDFLRAHPLLQVGQGRRDHG